MPAAVRQPGRYTTCSELFPLIPAHHSKAIDLDEMWSTQSEYDRGGQGLQGGMLFSDGVGEGFPRPTVSPSRPHGGARSI